MSACYLIQPSIAVVYVYPVGGKYDHFAQRFVTSYLANPTSIPHSLYVISNGGQPSPAMLNLFGGIPCEWFAHDNSGWDIGAFQAAARDIPAELMIFFGVSAYLRAPCWLSRAVESYHKYGIALYGAMGNLGEARLSILPHIRTTGFWLPPWLLNEYPYDIDVLHRYEFEHGRNCFTKWVRDRGLMAWVVNRSAEYPWPHWNDNPNGFNRGNQSELLVGDRISDLHG